MSPPECQHPNALSDTADDSPVPSGRDREDVVAKSLVWSSPEAQQEDARNCRSADGAGESATNLESDGSELEDACDSRKLGGERALRDLASSVDVDSKSKRGGTSLRSGPAGHLPAVPGSYFAGGNGHHADPLVPKARPLRRGLHDVRIPPVPAAYYRRGASELKDLDISPPPNLPRALFSDPDDMLPQSHSPRYCRSAADGDGYERIALLQDSFRRHVGRAKADIQRTLDDMLRSVSREQRELLGPGGEALTSTTLLTSSLHASNLATDVPALANKHFRNGTAQQSAHRSPRSNSSLRVPPAPKSAETSLAIASPRSSPAGSPRSPRSGRSPKSSGVLKSSDSPLLNESLGMPVCRVSDVSREKPEEPKKQQDSPAVTTKAVFGGGETLRQQIKEALERRQYDVRDFYWETGIAQAIGRSAVFENFTMMAVMAATIWIGFTAEMDENSSTVVVVENTFALYFLFEWTVRFLSFKDKKNCMLDAWFVFDTALLCLIVLETWVMRLVNEIILNRVASESSVLRVLQMVRLTRLARLVRLLRWMPELVVLLKGIMLASRSVFFTLLLLLMIVYIFALTFRQFTDGTELGRDYFPDVPTAMVRLLMGGVLPDQAEFVLRCGADGFVYAFLSMCFVLCASLTVMNMLVGVLVDVVALVSNIENETMVIDCVRNKMEHRFDELGLDADGDGFVSKEEFQTLLMDVDTAVFLDSIGIDVMTLVEFSDVIIGENALQFHEFIGALVQMRVGNPAKVKDIIDVRKFLLNEFDHRLKTLRVHIEEVVENGLNEISRRANSSRRDRSSHASERPRSSHPSERPRS
eukprot:TRINITY_DN8321_c0_g2_i1.p1 TRINITY_DN8321_c0_g2~~TRINITY_DN8321_c0_g2_i1.p1  ORF type:complete len:838 (-),score=157.75 TRINITY_DN8321_c0_g2_i1:104-2548(-)